MTVTTTVATNENLSPTFFPLQSSWLTELDHPPVAAPIHNETQIFIPLRDETLAALRMEDGSIDWTSDHSTRFSPLIYEDLIVIASANSLIGLSSSDAETIWTIDLGAATAVAPLLESGWLVAALESGEVVVLRASDGVEFWRETFSGTLEIQPSIGGNTLFVPVSDGRIIALDLRSGQRLWEYSLRGSPRKILPLDALFVGSTDNFMYRLSKENGRVEWMVRTGADIVGSPAVDERRVFFVSLDNVLRALDRESGNQHWRKILPGRPMSGPQIIDGMVLVSGVAPQLRAFDTETGVQAGVLEAPGEFAVMPHVIRSPSELAPGLIVTTGDGRLSLMGRPTGPPEFSMSFPPPPLLPLPETLAPADVLPFSPSQPQPLLRKQTNALSFLTVDTSQIGLSNRSSRNLR